MKMDADIGVVLLQAKEGQRLPGNYQKLSERHGTVSLLQSSEGTCPTHALISDLQPPEL